MQYDIFPGAVWSVNTIEGTKLLSYSEVTSLSNYDSDNVVYLGDSDILVLDFDFGYRINIDRVEYKFTASGFDDSTVASGIFFYYKNEDFNDYVNIPTSILEPGIFYTTETLESFAPRYFRIKHVLEDLPTVSGVLYGCKAYNNDTTVAFGSDGTKVSEDIDVVRGEPANIRAVAVYNNNNKLAAAYVNLEPVFSNLDEAISVSSSNSGPWISALDSSMVIANSTSFEYGENNGTVVTLGTLRIATDQTSGDYTTKIVNKEFDYCRFIIDKDENVGGRIIVDETDPVETIELRCSNYPPEPYAVYRTLIFSDGQVYYRDRWLVDDSVKETSSWYILSTGDYRYYMRNYFLVCDQITEMFSGFVSLGGYLNRQGKVYLFNGVSGGYKNELLLVTNPEVNSTVSFATYEVKVDVAGGMWVYFYSESYQESDFVDTTGYYFSYFDNDLNEVFTWFSTTKEVADIATDYLNKHVWYTKVVGEVCRTYIDGIIDVVYSHDDYTNDLGGIELLADGTVLFANGSDLYRLRVPGVLLDSYTLTSVAYDKITYIEKDPLDSTAVWVIDGNYVGRLYISGDRAGSYDFKIELFYPVSIRAVDDGVFVRCTDLNELDLSSTTIVKFISKSNKAVDYSYVQGVSSTPCLFYQNYDNINYSSKFPVPHDTVWNTLPWEKISTAGYLGKGENYYQLKIHMYREEDDLLSDTPIINALYRQDLLYLGAIEPGNYKNIYVKTYVSDDLIVNSGDIYLKARWRVPVN